MKRIRLGNTVFEGQNNVYVLDGDRTALVDTGVAVDPVREELVAGLADHGLALADVDEVFLTHWHYDHAGLAGVVQAESDATVHVHAADAPLVGADEDTLFEERRLQQEKFDEWGIPDEPRAELTSFLGDHADLAGRAADVTPFEDGATFNLGDRTLRAVHLPGHAAGLAAFALDGETGREAFVGDAVLPEYTPNVGGADVRVDDPLASYADSLVRVVDAGWDRAWPGHRDAIDRPARRAARILAHHRERTERVVDVLARKGACDAWTVSEALFGTLESIHILHGPGEAYAHLDHLESRGVVARDGRSPATYELTTDPEAVAVDDLFPTVDAEPLPEG
ncbi:MAG: MBL fold metallo-hydrolase [Halolamina sp.]